MEQKFKCVYFYLSHFFMSNTLYIYCMFMTVKLCNNIFNI